VIGLNSSDWCEKGRTYYQILRLFDSEESSNELIDEVISDDS